MTRLIDADALIEAMTKFSNATGEDMTHGIFYAHIAPTIDAEPVRYAENVGTDYEDVDQFVCSECGIELQDWRRVEHDDYDGEVTYHEYRLRCCPNCGARIKR